MTRIKICGIRRVEHGLAAARAGADAIGLVFYPASPRAVALDEAAAIAAAVGPFLTTVALFVNPEPEQVEQVLDQVKPHLLQFHGDEPAVFCEQFQRPYLKAIRVHPDTDIGATTNAFPSAAGFIFDAWSEALYGGTGKTFDWNRIRGFDGAPGILAGGLTPENVADAVSLTRPYGVDVSGGVESAPGEKDSEKIERFIRRARAPGNGTAATVDGE